MATTIKRSKWYKKGQKLAEETLTPESIQLFTLSRSEIRTNINESFERDLEAIPSFTTVEKCIELAIDGYAEEFVRQGGTLET